MKKKNFITLLMALIMLFTVLAFSGCTTAARKPAPPPDTTSPNQTAPNNTMTTNNTDTAKAKRIASETDKVDGVTKSTVVVAGSKAYVGIDINANIEKNQTKAVENEVSNRIKNVEPTINTVYVSSDVDTVTRLKKVAQGISQGKPVSSFARELSEIGRRLTPTVK
ncbi:sporulation lipoprotein, YhcN/YlaJ family [Desulfotomaculum arcticum]|uniref:Sporulation lipoprotein, YhcN/YlaJ family n=1 Tax=Desulfotruncus arcticus DSM 17038 TaxID=1121424 RepID=A0A1I2W2M5_9FIRM|nr:YhcN/YlaJ family sporulation lipoprotein [Desulfotruncus arcticus]SFG95603.1 sporulation lipoprotein, YhcN/YlaJ family [Desulfotomaculum arcticum] [Desulfotruncus arcticus DSM 17038]